MPIAKISSNNAILISKVCEVIPVVSALTILFQKYVLSKLERSEILKSHYYFYIQQRNSLLLSIPIVNVAAVIFRMYKGDSTESNMKEAILNAVEKTPEVLSYETAQKLSLTFNYNFMLVAAKKNLKVLDYAEGLSSDQKFMHELSKNDVNALQYVKGNLLSNCDFWINALIENTLAMNYLPDSFKDDEKFWLELVKKDVTFVEKVPQALRTSSFFLEAIKKNATIYPLMTEFLRDPGFLIRAVAVNPDVLMHVAAEPAIYSALFSIIEADRLLVSKISEELSGNREFKLALVKQIPELVGRFTIEDRQFYSEAAVSNPKVAKFFNYLFLADDIIEDLVLDVYKKNKDVLSEHVLRMKASFMLKVIVYDLHALKLAVGLRDNEEFMLKAIRINPGALDYLDPSLANDGFLAKARKVIDEARRK